MKRDDRERDAGCPLLMPGATKGRAGFQVAVYCRLPNGRVRVPTPDQLGSLCFAGRYRDCAGYRRWARSRLVPAASLP